MEGPEGYRRLLHWAVSDLPVEQRSVGQPAEIAAPHLDALMQDDQPWCCCVSYYDPNEAMVVGREAFESYDVNALPLPVTLRDPLHDRPGFYRRQQRICAGFDDDHWRHALACYYGRITELDAQVGRLVGQLQRGGALENTVIIFTADHGKYVGGHGLEAHNYGAFEEIYNIPMVIAGPGVATQGAVEARVGLHDLCPTLLELGGAQPIDAPDSRSFAPLLHDPVTRAANFTSGYAENFGTRLLMTQRVVWDGDWKFIFNGFDEDELYNLHRDPSEQTNLAAAPEYQQYVRTLTCRMWSRIHETGDQTLRDTHYYSMRLAAVGPDAAAPDAET